MDTLRIPRSIAPLCWLVLVVLTDGCTTSPSSAFLTDVTPSAQTITQGQSATFVITVSSKTNINSNVTFSLTGLSGATVTFSPPELPSTGTTATMTIQTNSSTVPQVFNLTLTMREEGTSSTSVKFLTLTVNTLSAARDFTLGVDQAAFSISFGLAHSVRAVISAFNGFEGDVTLSFSSPTPSITASSLPVTIHAGPAVENSYSFFVAYISLSAPPPSPVIATLTATSGGVSRSQTLSITVSSISTPGG